VNQGLAGNHDHAGQDEEVYSGRQRQPAIHQDECEIEISVPVTQALWPAATPQSTE
jgi:hypothetical protein